MHLNIICSFIEQIGITIREGRVTEDSFLPGIEIVKGRIVYDTEKLLYPGDILHEAGHLAMIPANRRHEANGNLKENNVSTDGEELGAMLWSYAACLHIGLKPEVVFHPDGYKGESEWILDQYAQGIYIGLPLLQWMQMCTVNEGDQGFPFMQKWLRD